MGNKHSLVEWLLNADFCRKMAYRTTDPARRSLWLMLAERWLKLGDADGLFKEDKEQFDAGKRDRSPRSVR